MKKPGYYLSEHEYIADLQRATNLAPFHRYPLTYIMEAADDIAYCIADLDDAIENGIFDVDTLYQSLKKVGGGENQDLFSEAVKKGWQDVKRSEQRHCSARDQFFITLTVKVQQHLVTYAVNCFFA